mmetsp:Transcript_69009/g.224979  ORF Transcript_69009/g.224979 Transcript_69009/m.224979 type:complete len:364 (+) Transcript_69009:187-1278(+)
MHVCMVLISCVAAALASHQDGLLEPRGPPRELADGRLELLNHRVMPRHVRVPDAHQLRRGQAQVDVLDLQSRKGSGNRLRSLLHGWALLRRHRATSDHERRQPALVAGDEILEEGRIVGLKVIVRRLEAQKLRNVVVVRAQIDDEDVRSPRRIIPLGTVTREQCTMDVMRNVVVCRLCSCISVAHHADLADALCVHLGTEGRAGQRRHRAREVLVVSPADGRHRALDLIACILREVPEAASDAVADKLQAPAWPGRGLQRAARGRERKAFESRRVQAVREAPQAWHAQCFADLHQLHSMLPYKVDAERQVQRRHHVLRRSLITRRQRDRRNLNAIEHPSVLVDVGHVRHAKVSLQRAIDGRRA